MQNQFYKVMNAYSDEELLAVYKDRIKYTPEAIEAMEMVLKERNLLEDAAEIVAEQQVEEILSREEQLAKFERSEFGRVVSDTDFAKESLVGSIYLQRFLSPLHNYNWLNHVFNMLGGLGLVFTLVFIGIGEYHSPVPTLLTISIIVIPLLPLGIWRLSKSKVQLTIRKKMNSHAIVIEGPKDHHELTLPVRYERYWEWNYIRKGAVRLKQVRLSIVLYDDLHDTAIILTQLMELHKSPPPHWKMLPANFSTKKKKSFTYFNHGFQKPYLYEFQKIIDGLQEGE